MVISLTTNERRILLSSGSITYVINKLEKKDYLFREQFSEDSRITYAKITPRGTDLVNGIFPDHWERIKDIMGILTIEEKVAAALLLKKLGTSLRKL
ncbi:MarR family winged helix-turn-helix transcriptional regulator [Oceanobacillus damuensis]|uniref:MarR family winged helix-turn-helix transcriptional regulator n=1 Tax=Oceanobacillus damuensis TaxID=937928 RepID=UPI00082D4B17|nr:winged helix DNA-binding protein [Oceanobacillus damuensis]